MTRTGRDLMYRFVRSMLAFGAVIWNRLEIHGKEYIPRGCALIVVSNHASFLDPPLVGYACRPRILHFIARDTLFKPPFFSWLLPRLKAIPLDRNKGDIGAIKTAVHVLKQGKALALFPEGTRTEDGRLQEAKGGVGLIVARAETPVLPLYIEGSFDAYPKGAKWVRPAKIRVHIGPVIQPEMLPRKENGKPDLRKVGPFLMEKIGALS